MRRTTEKTFKGAVPVGCLSYGFPISSSKCGGLSEVVYDMVFLLFEQSIEMMNCVLFELSIGRACIVLVMKLFLLLQTMYWHFLCFVEQNCLLLDKSCYLVDESSY